MTNQAKLKNIFSRSEEVEVGGEILTFHAPSVDYAVKIEEAQFALSKQLVGKDDSMTPEAIKAGKAYTQICVEAVLRITPDEARQLLVVVPSVGEQVNEFLGVGKVKEEGLGESPT